MDFEEGTFSSKIDKETIDFFIKMGAPKESCLSMIGLSWSFRTEIIDDGSWVIMMDCHDKPEFNTVDTYKIGQEIEVKNSPFVGGNAKLNLIPTGEKHKWHVKCDGESFKMDWEEMYSNDGLTITYKSQKAGTHKVMWSRNVKETGWFKMVKAENIKNFLKAQGIDSKDCWDENSESLVKFDKCGTTCFMTEVWKGVSNVVKYKLDEENDYSWPGIAEMDRKFVTTRTGKGKYLTIMKGNKGQREDWHLEFNNKGCVYSGLDVKSGQSCKIIYESFTNICGKFKPIASVGFQAYGKTIGMPSEMACKLANDFDAVLTISKKDNGMMQSKFESKICPMNMIFRFNEEFEHLVPGMPEKLKLVQTLVGDTMMYVGKSSKCTINGSMKFTDNFVIKNSSILGTTVKAKIIMERIC